MSKVLVATHGFFGDIAFATGLAEELSKRISSNEITS